MSALLAMLLMMTQAPGAAAQEKKVADAPAPKVVALPEGKQETLKALVIAVDGKAEWKAAGAAAFKGAAVNDLLDPGAEIRTGLRSTVTLRVGKNATLVVERASRVELPVMVQDGAVLRTRAAVHRGRCDFKVDELDKVGSVGITSDFQVLTPSATLAVRGTGFTVDWGAFDGVRFTGVDTNRVRAIELNYLASLEKFFISGAGTSSSAWPDPVQQALYDSVFPPLPPSLEIDGPDLLAHGPGGYQGALPRDPLWHFLHHEQQLNHGESDLGRSLGVFNPNGKPGR